MTKFKLNFNTTYHLYEISLLKYPGNPYTNKKMFFNLSCEMTEKIFFLKYYFDHIPDMFKLPVFSNIKLKLISTSI